MFEFSSKTKQLAIALTVVGAILWIVGFELTYDERWEIIRYVVKLREDQE